MTCTHQRIVDFLDKTNCFPANTAIVVVSLDINAQTVHASVRGSLNLPDIKIGLSALINNL